MINVSILLKMVRFVVQFFRRDGSYSVQVLPAGTTWAEARDVAQTVRLVGILEQEEGWAVRLVGICL